MPTRNYKIRLQTEADTQGTKKVQESFDNVKKSADEARKAISEGDGQKDERALDSLATDAKQVSTELNKIGDGEPLKKASESMDEVAVSAKVLRDTIPETKAGLEGAGEAAEALRTNRPELSLLSLFGKRRLRTLRGFAQLLEKLFDALGGQ